ncbi:DUF2493 domain-containing protein [Arthrobacter koreensis]|uniref:DUF2493 domain-containing protein n=1 Tax=Arthrobacter koreensis TaxID=199136 RepID=UPI0037F7F138
MSRVLVSGSRDWTDTTLIEQALNGALALLNVPATMQHTVTLVHGAAKGLDSLAAQAAQRRGWQIEGHPAQWDTHTDACPAWHQGLPTCKMAGHRRNHEMIALGADLLVSFPLGTEKSGHSKGTWGCTRAAMVAGLPTVVVWKNSFYPWGPAAERLVIAERAVSGKPAAAYAAAAALLDTLTPTPF